MFQSNTAKQKTSTLALRSIAFNEMNETRENICIQVAVVVVYAIVVVIVAATATVAAAASRV